MGLTLMQRLQWLFLGKQFTPEGNEIVKRKVMGLTITGKNYLKEIVREIPETGEQVSIKYYSLGKRRHYAEWIGPNFVRYDTFNS